jgi:mycobactin salicyl-AMP ligase
MIAQGESVNQGESLFMKPPAREIWAPEAGDEAQSSADDRDHGVAALLSRRAAMDPGATAFLPQPGLANWSGRVETPLTNAAAETVVTRLAARFTGFGLPPRALFGVALPAGTTACLTIAALDRAGLTPCLIPLGWSPERIGSVVESLGLAGVVTQSRVGDLFPAIEWRDLAMRYFGLRFLTAFGPGVPDGFTDLDAVAAQPVTPEPDTDASPPLGEAHGAAGYVSFDMAENEPDAAPVAWFRSWASARAAAEGFVAAAHVAPQERLLTLLAQDDHRGLTTGLMAALISGCALEAHGLFASDALAQSLPGDAPVRLVAPGWMEADLARLDFPENLCGVVLVHRAPVRFKAQTPLTHGVVDALAFGEIALLSQARDARGRFALSLDRPAENAGLLAVQREADGRIQFRGMAAQAAPLDGRTPPVAADIWRDCGFVAEVFAGIVIGVTRAETTGP